MYSQSQRYDHSQFDKNGELVSLTSRLKSQCDSIPDRDVLNP